MTHTAETVLGALPGLVAAGAGGVVLVAVARATGTWTLDWALLLGAFLILGLLVQRGDGADV